MEAPFGYLGGGGVEARGIPPHLIHAITSSEDRRFFFHPGVDCHGISRAIVKYPNGGGGSTITQQMYWGHGMFGIESASSFYFQKQPIFLTVGESALLAGILPAPEILNPFTDPRRGKSSQQRVLRRMVAEGFLDMETALKVAKQPLRLHKENKEVLV
ncbi:Penicillin-binding protein 1F [Ananas comosus]|uniref:Penicillin-binding protein 1F n=1 Tax=Ananas comosus TaxID=4615 RepID=A0A199UQX6_ANACO|nr:Penicillin-binding protein 1F [Ananas comosus]